MRCERCARAPTASSAPMSRPAKSDGRGGDPRPGRAGRIALFVARAPETAQQPGGSVRVSDSSVRVSDSSVRSLEKLSEVARKAQ